MLKILIVKIILLSCISLVINTFLYIVVLFLPCNIFGSGWTENCENDFINELNALLLLVVQFKPTNVSDIKFALSLKFGSLWWSLGLWMIVLSPFLLFFYKEKLKLSHKMITR